MTPSILQAFRKLALHASCCLTISFNLAFSSTKAPEGMVYIPGGSFLMGGDAGFMDGGSASHQTAYPIHEVTIAPFFLDKTEVTNRDFAAFVEATGYITFAERPLDPEVVAQLEDAAERNLAALRSMLSRTSGEERAALEGKIAKIEAAAQFDGPAGSIVFQAPTEALYDERDLTNWWRMESHANWRQPEGPGSSWKDRLDHPVVNVTREDAAAYAAWVGKRLPTEAEWERAARGGLVRKPFAWGDVFQPEGEDKWMANTWQGVWPYENNEADGYRTTSPVKSFPPNPFGLFDIAGNVWEIVADHYHPATYQSRQNPSNPTGPSPELLARYGQPTSVFVTRGGSFLCSDSWCSGYQPGSRQPFQSDSPAQHIGFRCAQDIPPEPEE